MGRLSIRLASSSLTICSACGPQLIFRRNRMAILAKWQRVAVRCLASVDFEFICTDVASRALGAHDALDVDGDFFLRGARVDGRTADLQVASVGPASFGSA